MDIDTFSSSCDMLPGKMDFNYHAAAPSIEFSNTGARGKKYFVITLHALLQTLKDIQNNLPEFLPHTTYVEKNWRDLFSAHLTDHAVNALSTVQTLPLFSVISKTLHVTNNLKNEFDENHMSLSAAHIDKAISEVESMIPDASELTKASKGVQGKKTGKGVNQIYYGAPGTGKSYSIDKAVVDDFTIRTVFHADTQNSDFIGCLKPVIEKDEITYKFRSGPFTDAVVNALIDPEHHYWLVIEEINRAPAAAVFGEIFQLLDRDENGNSKYQIDIADPDMLVDINKRLEGSDIGSIYKLYIPGNLSVLATMNSSDQAVMPMDTAFKRRWQFKYIALDFDHDYAKGTLPIPDGNGSVIETAWKDFATAINSILSENSIPEDRHLGPFFLSEEEMVVDGDDRKEILTGKLFMYLWDDVLRHGYRETIFLPEIKTYGQLNKMFNEDKDVFSKGFRALLSTNYPVHEEKFEGFPQAAEPATDD